MGSMGPAPMGSSVGPAPMGSSMGPAPMSQAESEWDRSSKSVEEKVDEWRKYLQEGLRELKEYSRSAMEMQETRIENQKIINNFRRLTPVVQRLSERKSVMNDLDAIENRQVRLMEIIQNINSDLGVGYSANNHPTTEKIK